MPSRHNITGTAQWTTPIAVPDDGARITADANGGSDGPVNPAFQDLMDRDKAIAQGVVSLKSVSVDGVGEAAGTAGAGEVGAVGDIFTALGNVQAIIGDVVAGQDVSAARDVNAARDVTASRLGDVTMDGSRVVFTNIDVTASGGNPPGTTSLVNDFRPLLAPKAWGRFKTNGTVNPDIIDRGNILTMVAVAGTAFLLVTFAGAMADANYSVTCNLSDTNGVPLPVCMYPLIGADAAKRPVAASFYLSCSPFLWDTDIVECCFHVDGRQTS